MTKVAEYEVERVAMYAGTQVKGQIKTVTLYRDELGWAAQIGGGAITRCSDYTDHEERGGFIIGKGRWIKA